jgi:hypothetical protein
MPTRTAKKKTPKTKQPGVKRKARAKAGPKATASAGPAHKTGFMWKLLEQKKNEQKEKSAHGSPTANPWRRDVKPENTHGFGRFHGPRRRAS